MIRSVETADQLLDAKRSGKTGVIRVAPDDTVEHALHLMAEKDIGAVVVTDNDKLVGLMSERDYARKVELQAGGSARTKLVREIMTREIIPAKPADSVETCRRLMNDNQIRHLPVCDQGRVIGVPSIRDIRQGRGLITVVDRPGLEETCCGCYGAIRRSFERLLPGTYEKRGSSAEGS